MLVVNESEQTVQLAGDAKVVLALAQAVIYLALAPNAPDAPFIRQQLQQ